MWGRISQFGLIFGGRGLKFNVGVVHCMYGNAHFLIKTSCRCMQLCQSTGTNSILIFLLFSLIFLFMLERRKMAKSTFRLLAIIYWTKIKCTRIAGRAHTIVYFCTRGKKECCGLKRNNHKPMLQGVYSHQCNKYNLGKICSRKTYSKARRLIFACRLYYTPTNEPLVCGNSSLLSKHFMDATGFRFLCTLI